MSKLRPVVLVMGVSGAGKTTVGRHLAEWLDCPFVDADDLHPPENVARMRSGRPLEDEHRWPWLDAVAARLRELARARDGGVMACSALKESYRVRLDLESLAGGIVVFLTAPRDVLAERLARRGGHFFPPSLLDSQLETLEVPAGALRIEAVGTPQEAVERIIDALGAAGLDAESPRGL